jgi:c-di-GMP-binding flagellar brake protein YcgR
MTQIKMENVIIDYDGRQITFEEQDKWRFSFHLEVSAVSDLIEYFRSFQVNDIQRRRAFRVPLTASSDLSVILEYRDKSCPVNALNISLTGILIEFESDDVYDMAIGGEVNLTLKLGDKAAKISGKIMRRDGNQYGIFFPDTIVENEVQPPAPLQSIVLVLEREWMRKRIKL